MIQDTKNNQEYISNQRYIVMIEDLDAGRAYYSKRIGSLRKAINVAAEYNALAGVKATIIDTKLDEMI